MLSASDIRSPVYNSHRVSQAFTHIKVNILSKTKEGNNVGFECAQITWAWRGFVCKEGARPVIPLYEILIEVKLRVILFEEWIRKNISRVSAKIIFCKYFQWTGIKSSTFKEITLSNGVVDDILNSQLNRNIGSDFCPSLKK